MNPSPEVTGEPQIGGALGADCSGVQSLEPKRGAEVGY